MVYHHCGPEVGCAVLCSDLRCSRMTLDDRPMPRSHDEGKGELPPRADRDVFFPHREVMHGIAARVERKP